MDKVQRRADVSTGSCRTRGTASKNFVWTRTSLGLRHEINQSDPQYLSLKHAEKHICRKEKEESRPRIRDEHFQEPHYIMTRLLRVRAGKNSKKNRGRAHLKQLQLRSEAVSYNLTVLETQRHIFVCTVETIAWMDSRQEAKNRHIVKPERPPIFVADVDRKTFLQKGKKKDHVPEK